MRLNIGKARHYYLKEKGLIMELILWAFPLDRPKDHYFITPVLIIPTLQFERNLSHKNNLKMDINWNTTLIDPQNLIKISRGDNNRIYKYLIQFQDLIPSRMASLKNSLETEDRRMTRQILHQMSPQLQFFGIPDVEVPIRRLEHEYQTMDIDELKALVNGILINLDAAVKEVEMIIKNNFESH